MPKITQLTELTAPITTDMLAIVDDPSGSPVTKKVQSGNLFTDGWINDGLTWTYASASTFTIAGDVTAIYQKGTFLKWTQTTVKYGVVASSSYSAPNTTVTIIVNADYTIANAAISANYWSYSANPRGWPDWFNWTSTRTGYSAAPTDTTTRYRVIGRTVHFNIREVTNGTSNAVTLSMSLPVAALTLTNLLFGGPASLVDNSAAMATYGRWTIGSAGTTMVFGTTASAADGFTNSGGKRVAFCEGFYQF